MTQVRLEPAASQSRVKHSTTESLRSLPITLRMLSNYACFIFFFTSVDFCQNIYVLLSSSFERASTNLIILSNIHCIDHMYTGLQIRLYWRTIFFISHPKHMLWVLKRTMSMSPPPPPPDKKLLICACIKVSNSVGRDLGPN